MSTELRTLNPDVISSLVINGDLKRLTPQQKVEYYSYRCQQAGLDPAAKPFDLLTLNGKEILYANASATQQLTSIHKLSHAITSRELTDGIYCVFCRVTGSDGRSTENMGAVPIDNLKGEAKANAMLKATTKAIRRTVLAHMGLGLMDETEVDTIPGATKTPMTMACEPETIPAEPIIKGWTIEAQEQFALLADRLYTAFRDAGKMNLHAAEAEKWRKRMSTLTAPEVLKPMEEHVAKLEEAAKKTLEGLKGEIGA